MLGYCEKLLKEGKAYVDDTDAETMKVSNNLGKILIQKYVQKH